MESENFAGARFRIALIGEAGDDAGGFVEEGEWLAAVLDPFQFGDGVILRLVFDGGDVLTERFLFRLDHTDGFAIHEEHIIGRTGVSVVFPDRLTRALGWINGIFILHVPARGAKLRINLVAGHLLRVLIQN